MRAAYDAMQARDYDTATRLYGDVARDDARNVDALLGLAAIATNRGDVDDARNRYLAVLRIEPAHALAQAALLALFGRADYITAELKLKELAGREPSAFVYQALATLYAEQGLWPQAQHAYFEAYRLNPRDPDHAYNLAVGLDHVGQHALAATYYNRAVDLARTHPTTAFDIAQAASRAARLAAAGSN
ncbi:MAG TPA: tetratricopeptide repeat protein [Burkholderiales bacterium]|nr:tetratricopeptide repeat protein [Burkholderiales bacterium]